MRVDQEAGESPENAPVVFSARCPGNINESTTDPAISVPMIARDVVMGILPPYHESIQIIFKPTKTSTAANP